MTTNIEIYDKFRQSVGAGEVIFNSQHSWVECDAQLSNNEIENDLLYDELEEQINEGSISGTIGGTRLYYWWTEK